jgi:hypothetical protein
VKPDPVRQPHADIRWHQAPELALQGNPGGRQLVSKGASMVALRLRGKRRQADGQPVLFASEVVEAHGLAHLVEAELAVRPGVRFRIEMRDHADTVNRRVVLVRPEESAVLVMQFVGDHVIARKASQPLARVGDRRVKARERARDGVLAWKSSETYS